MRGVTALLLGLLLLLAGLYYLRPQVGMFIPPEQRPGILGPRDAFLRVNVSIVRVGYTPSDGRLLESRSEERAVGATVKILLYGGSLVDLRKTGVNGSVLFRLRPGVYYVAVQLDLSGKRLSARLEVKAIAGVESRIHVRFYEYTPLIVRVELLDENVNGILDVRDPIRVVYAYRPVGLLEFVELLITPLYPYAPLNGNITLYSYFEDQGGADYYSTRFGLQPESVKGVDVEAILTTSIFTLRIYRVWWG